MRSMWRKKSKISFSFLVSSFSIKAAGQMLCGFQSSRDRNHQENMRYLPKSPADRAEMLREIGAANIDELFSHIPAEYRFKRDLKVPRQMAESEIIDYFKERSGEMAAGYGIMLGAGSYYHYRPVIIDS